MMLLLLIVSLNVAPRVGMPPANLLVSHLVVGVVGTVLLVDMPRFWFEKVPNPPKTDRVSHTNP